MRTVDGIEDNIDFVRSLSREALFGCVFHAFKFASICTKHPGFREEKEWRVIYIPEMEKSTLIKKDIEVINGTPQPVHKIPLKDVPEEGLVGIEIPELIDRIIIGPTDYGVAMLEAFRDLLSDAGVENPIDRIHVSSIPLRV